MANNRLSIHERISTKTKQSGDCLVWHGYKNAKGYGLMRIKGDWRLVHRVVWSLANGEIPDGHVIMHSCDNPSCVNIKHLASNTKYANVRDMHDKGRAIFNRGENHPGSKLKQCDVDEIRKVYSKGCKINGAKALSRRFCVAKTTILAIVKNQAWKIDHA